VNVGDLYGYSPPTPMIFNECTDFPTALRAEMLRPHNRGVASGSQDFVMGAEHIDDADRFLERGNPLTLPPAPPARDHEPDGSKLRPTGCGSVAPLDGRCPADVRAPAAFPARRWASE
jgi:hypothetical protein